MFPSPPLTPHITHSPSPLPPKRSLLPPVAPHHGRPPVRPVVGVGVLYDVVFGSPIGPVLVGETVVIPFSPLVDVVPHCTWAYSVLRAIYNEVQLNEAVRGGVG